MRRLATVAILAMAVTTALPMPGGARDLGIRGATWPVAEPDLLAQIEARLQDMERSGEMARLETQARERARRRLEEPDPLPGIAPARERRTRLFDPAIVVAEDILGPDGALVAAAGTRIDPFAHVPLTRDLLFIDGRREVEVGWALAHEKPSKLVLLAGRPLDLMRRYRRPFFFDLGGRLKERFAVRETPTLVERDGAHLRLTEIPLDDRAEPGPASKAEAGPCASGPHDSGSARPSDRRRPEPC